MPHNIHTALPLTDALHQLEVAAQTPFEQATPIPPALNHAQAYFEHELRAVFMQEWICVGREDEVAEPGEYMTHSIAGVPVLVVRQPNRQLAAFVNACAHRFACLVAEARGSTKSFTCRYHAWTYALDGSLVRAPHMAMKPGFEAAEHRLRTLAVACWEGFVYVTLAENPTTEPSHLLAPLTEAIVGRYAMAGYQTVLRESMCWNANWKNLIENFTESYHVPVAHGKTFANHNKPVDSYVCGEDSYHYCYHYAVQPEATGAGAAHPDNTRLTGEWRRTMVDFCVFPNHLVTLMPDYLWYISVQPEGVDRFQATWSVAVPPEVLGDIEPSNLDTWINDFRHYIDVANAEDEVLVEALHRGSASTILPSGAYHPIERNLWQFVRYLGQICVAT